MTGHGEAWGWVAALRSGSTTPWRAWLADGGGEAPAFADALPGAQQLALLHRLNLAAAAGGRTVPRATADRVLAAGVSGRGRGDLPLIGLDGPARFGLRPVDPDALPEEELLRVAVGLIADDIADRRPDTAREPSLLERARHAHRPWRRAFTVVGVQWRAEAARAGLAVQGMPSGGRRPTAYLLADDLASVISHAWTARSFDQGGPTWAHFVDNFASSGRLPPRADLARMARSAIQRYGPESLRIVLDPRLMADELGVARVPGPPRLGANAVDLVRRVGEPLGLLVTTDERPVLLRAAFADRFDGLGGPAPTMPVRWEGWLRSEAERIMYDLATADHPVLGDLESLLPAPLAAEATGPDDAEVLALALDLLLDPVTFSEDAGGSYPTEGRR